MMRRPRICQGSQIYELTDLGFVFGKPQKGEKKNLIEPDCFNWEQHSEEEAKTKGEGMKIPV